MAKVAGFSEATYIGLHCMALISENEGKRLSIKEMAEELKVSEAHLAKVILRLSRSGLLHTTRGPRGGAVLAKKDDEITYLEILEAIEGPLEGAGCVFGRKECVYKRCIFGGFLGKVTQEITDWLRSQTLANFRETGREKE